MNRQRVIVLMTVAVFFVLLVPLTAIFGGVRRGRCCSGCGEPCVFLRSHCRTKPFTGPTWSDDRPA